LGNCRSAAGSVMSERPRIDISPESWQVVRDLLRRHVPDRAVWAFGSRAKRTAKAFSDLDLVVVGEETLGIDRMATLREAFQDSVLPFKVDIVDWALAEEQFRKTIEESRVLLQDSQPLP